VHESRFSRAILIASEKNTGISGNCNRGIAEARGAFVKFIAGDDLLVPECIERFVSYLKDHNEVSLVCSGMQPFCSEVKYRDYFPPEEYDRMSARQQYRRLLREGTLFPAPALFYRRCLFEDFGGFDERYQFVEDYPFFIKVTNAGKKIHLLRLPLVKYRIYPESVSRDVSNNRFITDYCRYIDEVVVQLLRENRMYMYLWHFTLDGFLRRMKAAANPFWGNIWTRRAVLCLDPVYIKNRFNKIIGRDYLSKHNEQQL